jgi:acid stress-induced BolA-like protein IbaG/YrbA
MEDFKEKVESIINAAFGENAAELEELESGRVSGFVVSVKFDDKSDKERQDMLWAVLEEKLPRGELLNVSFLITLTPDEEEAYAE